MHRIMLMAGSILASSFGFALAGLALGHAIRNSRRSRPVNRSAMPVLGRVDMDIAADAWNVAVRGYDTPELAREDGSARKKSSGTNRTVA
jgi:hypothetical protein